MKPVLPGHALFAGDMSKKHKYDKEAQEWPSGGEERLP